MKIFDYSRTTKDFITIILSIIVIIIFCFLVEMKFVSEPISYEETGYLENLEKLTQIKENVIIPEVGIDTKTLQNMVIRYEIIYQDEKTKLVYYLEEEKYMTLEMSKDYQILRHESNQLTEAEYEKYIEMQKSNQYFLKNMFRYIIIILFVILLYKIFSIINYVKKVEKEEDEF